MRRRTFIATAGALTLAPAIARAQILPPGQYLQQLTIGVSVPLSGPLEAFGKGIVQGAQAAVDETNKYNVSLKIAYGVRSFDDQNSTQIAVTNAQIAAADPTIIAMIGNLTSDVTVAALPSYANSNFAIFVPTVTADTVTTRGYRNVYRLPTNDSSQGVLVAQTVLPAHKNTVAVAVAVDGSYGPDIANGFVKGAKSSKAQASVVILDPKSFDPAGSASLILAHSPAHVFLAGRPSQLGPVIEAMQLAGYSGAYSASDAFYTQETIDKYATILNGVPVATFIPPLDRIPSIYQLLRDFEQEVGNVNPFQAYGYAAAQLIILASQRTNATTRFTLLTTMQQQQLGSPFTTLVGQFSFNYNGDPAFPNIYFWTIGKNGFTFSKPAIPTGFVV